LSRRKLNQLLCKEPLRLPRQNLRLLGKSLYLRSRWRNLLPQLKPRLRRKRRKRIRKRKRKFRKK
jgi:hypothetical protein